MGYLLIWVELLVIAVLLAMVIVSLLARVKPHAVRVIVGLVCVALPVALAVAVFNLRHSFYYFYDYTISLVISTAVAIGVVVAWGFRPICEGHAIRARSWPLGRVAIALLIACGLHILTMWNMDAAARSAVGSLRSEASAVALSVAPPRPADHENAAFVYYKAFQSLDLPEEFKDFGVFEQEIERHPDLMRTGLQSKRVTLDLIRRAAAMPECRFDRDYARPSISMLLPEVQHLRTAGTLLYLRARVRAIDGEFGDALEDISALFRIARHAGSDGLLISQMVAVGIHAEACSALEKVLNATTPTQDEFSKLRTDDVLRFESQLDQALLMEEAFIISSVSEFSSIFPESVMSRALSSPLAAYVSVFIMPSELEAYHRGMAAVRRAVRQPGDQQAAELKSISQHGSLLTRALMPALDGYLRAVRKADAKQALVLALVAAAGYRAEHSKLPTSIDDLEGNYVQVPLVDPYDGKPIRLKSTEDALIIYSVGPDRVDDDGGSFNEETQKGDISMILRLNTQSDGGSDSP